MSSDSDYGICDKAEDDTHCNCWWDGGPCCYCGAGESDDWEPISEDGQHYGECNND